MNMLKIVFSFPEQIIKFYQSIQTSIRNRQTSIQLTQVIYPHRSGQTFHKQNRPVNFGEFLVNSGEFTVKKKRASEFRLIKK